MNIAVITGASSGLGVKFLEAVLERYPDLDEYWIIARRKERLDALAAKHEKNKIIAIDADFGNNASYDKLREKLQKEEPKIKVLISNAGFERTGDFAKMKDSDILNMELLSQEETAKYIKARLEAAGSTTEVFTSQALKAISSYSKGNPRIISKLCNSAMLIGDRTGKNTIDDDVILQTVNEVEL